MCVSLSAHWCVLHCYIFAHQLIALTNIGLQVTVVAPNNKTVDQPSVRKNCL